MEAWQELWHKDGSYPAEGFHVGGNQRGHHTTPLQKPPLTRLHLGCHCLSHSLAEIPPESLEANADSEEVKVVGPAHTLALGETRALHL